jgi:hypothetical protein
MSRALALGLVVLAAAAPAHAATTVSLHATVAPASIGLGDRFVYTVEARATGGSSPSLRVFADTGPFVVVSGPRASRSGDGLRVTQTLQCVDRGCVPNTGPRRVFLPPPRATLGATSVKGSPAAVVLVPRVPEKVVGSSRAAYLRQTAVMPPTARLPLGAAAAGAIVLAILAGLGAIALVGSELRRRGAGRRELARRAGGLQLALQLLRESARRPVPDRRRAADLVAREAGTVDATRVAWSRHDPRPQDVEELARQIEAAAGSHG